MQPAEFPSLEDRLDVHPSVYIAPQALVYGTVTIGQDSSVWPMTVIRGDTGVIRIGARTNIQDACVLHADPEAPLTIGSDVTIGHGAIVHGCTVGDEVLIGIGAVLLNNAQIGPGCLIAARALVVEGMRVPAGSLVIGIPAQIRPLRADQLERVRANARRYVRLKQMYLDRRNAAAS
jgi:carbonic anhydrase/acetyltransferase-like protein (isoleucine patch superfamily)